MFVPLSVEDYLKLPEARPSHRLSYGLDREQFGDLYLPAGAGPHPVVVLLHGGCWQAKYALGPLGGLCAAFAGEGYAVWNLEYRRLGNGGGWPATFLDVAAGADLLRSISQRHALDLSRVIAAGHSAGGHLAAWLGARHRLPVTSALVSPGPLRLRGVLTLAGIIDLAEGMKRKLCGGACGQLLGGTPDQVPDRYAQASPTELAPLGIPQWHLAGLADTVVPPDYVQQSSARMGLSDSVRIEVIGAAGHFELVQPSGPAWDAVRTAARRLFGDG